MLLLPVTFCTPIHKHECDLNIERGKGANVTLIDRPFISKTLYSQKIEIHEYLHKYIWTKYEIKIKYYKYDQSWNKNESVKTMYSD